jgi:predicted dienelactone hydrolase
VLAVGLVLLGAAVTVALIRSQSARRAPRPTSHAPARATGHPAAKPVIRPASHPRGPFAVGLLVLRLVDRRRQIGGKPRTVVTVVRYPAVGAPSATDLPNALPERAAGPFPLVVFAHGYRLAPYTYTRLLRAWAHAGYVVAAPFFPLTNADAPVVDRSDLSNQPHDLRFVISRLLVQRGAPLGSLVDGTRIALGGHSDGVDTALAVAYGQPPDPRVRAALGFSGAEISAFTGFSGSPRGVPLLAVQGTADSVNSPSSTYSYFANAARPKYLLKLLGAEHTAPYQDEQPHLAIVARVSTAFLDRYLKGEASAGPRLAALGSVPGRSTLQIER